MSQIKTLDKVYIAELLLFALIVIGILPRETSILLAIGLAIYTIVAPLEDGTLFFVRSIPLFIAIPITIDFDNLNTWRILSIILFLKLAHITGLKYFLKFKEFSRHSKILLGLLVLAFLSVIPASDKVAAVARIIFFINFSLVGIVIYQLITNNRQLTIRIIKNIAIPTILVTIVGFLQVISTYLIDIYQFMRIWGEGIQLNQFGQLWSDIAVRLGNTWFAYYGDQLSLRVFSLFPDSHSFPQFILLGLASIFALSLVRVTGHQSSVIDMVRTRASMSVLWVAAIFLAAILSGTRGIWAASVGVVLLIFIIIYWMRRTRISIEHKNIFKYISLYMLVFFLLFAVAYPIFVSPQFLLSKGDWALFGDRIRSIIDFGETSNAARIEIWKASLESIKEHPILGVGIGNFPVVLDQRVFLARAGSSAHNLYLHIASEMGPIAMVLFVWFLWLVFKKTYTNFIKTEDNFLRLYFGASLLFVPWVLIYSLTDIALLDERSFLMFITVISLILAQE